VPDLSPPRSDRVNAGDLSSDIGESSSKDTQIDLSPPENDAKAHPKSAETISAAEAADSGSGVAEFRPWDPHKAAKDVEVGDFYFKRKNYRAAEDRYREALYYKDDDAIATFQLAVCLEKLDRPDDALAEYQSYLRILPHGPQAEESKKAIERLKGAAVNAKQGK
jgi:tetratricopeptide (TPR) repeat protein